MDLYLSSLVLGAAGLGAMALSGIGSHGHDGSAGAHAHSAGDAGHGHGDAHHGGSSKTLWLITSPRVLFSVLLGLGTTGELAKPFLGGPLLLVTAIAGGIAFERLVVSPLWNFMMRFASKPASTLESAVADEATAVTSFDENGQGIVSLEVDGQIVQILATLAPNDRALGGSRIRAGQRVRIDDVDSGKNRCTVSLI